MGAAYRTICSSSYRAYGTVGQCGFHDDGTDRATFSSGTTIAATPVAVHDLRWITVMLLTLWAIGALLLAKGGNVSLYYDGKKVGEGRVERTVPMAFSADETTDVGRDTATPVSADYTRRTSVFNGKVNWVQIDLGKDDHDHFISPEERLNLAMARQ
jgi:hypothetical protein